MDESTLTALSLTLQFATTATLLVFIPSVAFAYLLARYEFFGKQILATVLALPLVLPPTAVGYLLLRAFASDGWFGVNNLGFDLDVILTGRGIVVACTVMAMPLVIRTARVSFEGVNPRYESMAYTLGYGPLATFLLVTLPLASRGLLAAAILGFSRAMGEFGASITIAGNIPGKTQTLASAIFSAQQVGNDDEAYFLLGVAIVTGFIAILLSEYLARARPGFLNKQ